MKARLIEAAQASHLWALRAARAALTLGIAGLDRDLPALAERRVFQVAGEDGPLECRLYRPVGVAADAPILLFFHGGGFVVSDLDTHEALCVRLADAAGMRVISASYRLAPEARYPAQLTDALAVTTWLLGEGAGGLGGDGAIAVGGDSAGAFLAATVASRVTAVQPDAIRAQLLIYPLVHLDQARWSVDVHRQTRVIGWAAVRYINAQLLEGGAIAPSLLTFAAAFAGPTLIVAGGALDPCRVDTLQLADRMRTAGRTVVLREYPAMPHGFANLTHVSAAARRAITEIGEMLGGLVRD